MESMKSEEIKIVTRPDERDDYNALLKLFQDNGIPVGERLDYLGLFARRQSLSRLIFMYEIYKKIVDVHGVIMEFGVRWGQDLVWYQNFRGMLEPFNHNRKIIGFDTFAGFPNVSKEDNLQIHKKGEMAVIDKYASYLEKIMAVQEKFSPISHIKRFELVQGDASITIHQYLERHPETIVALAYFDMDLYKPTKNCLAAIKDRLTKGSILCFDEINHQDWTGETLALKEVLGIRQVKIQRLPFMPTASYIVIE